MIHLIHLLYALLSTPSLGSADDHVPQHRTEVAASSPKAKRGVFSATATLGPPLRAAFANFSANLFKFLATFHSFTSVPLFSKARNSCQLPKQLFVDDKLTPGIKVAIVLPSEHGVFPTKELDVLLVN